MIRRYYIILNYNEAKKEDFATTLLLRDLNSVNLLCGGITVKNGVQYYYAALEAKDDYIKLIFQQLVKASGNLTIIDEDDVTTQFEFYDMVQSMQEQFMTTEYKIKTLCVNTGISYDDFTKFLPDNWKQMTEDELLSAVNYRIKHEGKIGYGL